MESKAPDTLERIQQAALDEFSEKGFLWSLSAADRETRWSNYGAFTAIFPAKRLCLLPL